MKKVLALVLCLVLALSMTGCRIVIDGEEAAAQITANGADHQAAVGQPATHLCELLRRDLQRRQLAAGCI